MTLPKLMEQFGSEDACHEALEELRWPEGVDCPRCGGKTISRIKARRQFDCDDCRYQFSVRVGTIFHDSKLPLWKWFLAVYMMCESKKGVSANQIKRMIGVSYKTAWYLCHRIRAAMRDEDQRQLSGTVEIDETWVGGVAKGKGYGYKGNKAVVIAAVERGGEARVKVVPDRRTPTVRRFVERNVSRDTDAIYTDELSSYDFIDREHDAEHASVKHSLDEWVNGQVHTNTVEGVHSLLKRSIIGSYHKVSKKHLPAYVDEMEWRYNNRENPYLFRDTIVELVNAERMQYKVLTA